MSIRNKLYEIIFEAETKAGKAFDLWLIIFVILSIVTVTLESIETLQIQFSTEFFIIEWFFTIVFTIEYVLRLICVKSPGKYAFSFFGLVDFLSIIPAFISIFVPGAQGLQVIRGLRILRIFRILKLSRYTFASQVLYTALKQSRHKIVVFLSVVLTSVFIIGAAMYIIEGRENGYTSIPISVYWAIVTMTTVGYGDITPQSPLGQILSSVLMITGYGVLAVPTGIISLEIANATKSGISSTTCRTCLHEGHEPIAIYCHQCGAQLKS